MVHIDGWIKLHRRLLEWEWYKDTNTKAVFLHLLLLANIGASKYKGYLLTEGQLVTSVAEISDATNLTTKQVRTAINHLKTTNEVAIKTTNKFTLVTIVNWAFYQSPDDEAANKTASVAANEGQTKGKQRASIVKEVKNLRIKEYISMSDKPTDTHKFIPPSVDEVAAYCVERNNSVDAEKFVDFYSAKGWYVGKNRMKDWKAAVRTWEKDNKPKNEGVNHVSGKSSGTSELDTKYGTTF